MFNLLLDCHDHKSKEKFHPIKVKWSPTLIKKYKIKKVKISNKFRWKWKKISSEKYKFVLFISIFYFFYLTKLCWLFFTFFFHFFPWKPPHIKYSNLKQKIYIIFNKIIANFMLFVRKERAKFLFFFWFLEIYGRQSILFLFLFHTNFSINISNVFWF